MSIWAKRLLACASIVAFMLGSRAAMADEDPPSTEAVRQEAATAPLAPVSMQPQALPGERRPLQTMTRDELVDEGFVFADSEEGRSRARAIILAATAGTAVHGIGHWYIGDQKTALILMSMQGVGMGMLGTALGGYLWGGDQFVGSSRFIGPLVLVGGGLFVLSYFIDVVGTLYSDEMGLPANTQRTRGVSVNARYVYIKPEQTFLRHLLVGELRLDSGRVYVAPRTMHDVGLEMSNYGGKFGYRPWRGRLPLSYVFAEVESDYLTQRVGPRYDRVDVGGHLGISLDLGEFSTHLTAMAIGMSVGVGQRYYRFSLDEEKEPDWTRAEPHMPIEMFTHVNLSESFNARVSVVRQRGNFLQTNQRRVAMPVFEITYRSTPKLDLLFRAEYGDGFALSGGLMIWAWE